VLEATTRRRGGASRLDPSVDDDGTTRRIARAYVLAAAAGPFARLLPFALLPRAAAPIGVGLQAVGLGLRAWSMETLGGAYTRMLRIEGEQRVVEGGPYRAIRHPGYLGSILVWTGFALTTRRVGAALLVGGLLGDAYRRRIAAEEELLLRKLPGYPAYVARTRRLLPRIW
jgi:protein-S-isoprenylcysteine O-methyltransferase